LGFPYLANIYDLAWCAPGARFLVEPLRGGLIHPGEKVCPYVSKITRTLVWPSRLAIVNGCSPASINRAT
jgi:hypothetical protein